MVDCETIVEGVQILEDNLNPEELTAEFRSAIGDAGAIVTFTGIVRAEADVEELTLSHYPEFTERMIGKFLQASKERFDIEDAVVRHRVGAMKPREPIVWVGVSALHRRAAFEAADFRRE